MLRNFLGQQNVQQPDDTSVSLESFSQTSSTPPIMAVGRRFRFNSDDNSDMEVEENDWIKISTARKTKSLSPQPSSNIWQELSVHSDSSTETLDFSKLDKDRKKYLLDNEIADDSLMHSPEAALAKTELGVSPPKQQISKAKKNLNNKLNI